MAVISQHTSVAVARDLCSVCVCVCAAGAVQQMLPGRFPSPPPPLVEMLVADFILKASISVSVFSARQHAERAVCYRPSVCPSIHLSVCLSHRWICRKWLKLGSCNFHHTVAPSLSCLQYKFHPEIPTGSPEWGRQTRVGCGNELILSVF